MKYVNTVMNTAEDVMSKISGKVDCIKADIPPKAIKEKAGRYFLSLIFLILENKHPNHIKIQIAAIE